MKKDNHPKSDPGFFPLFSETDAGSPPPRPKLVVGVGPAPMGGSTIRGPLVQGVRRYDYLDGTFDLETGGVIVDGRFAAPAHGPRFKRRQPDLPGLPEIATDLGYGDQTIGVGFHSAFRNYYHWMTQCLLNIYILRAAGVQKIMLPTLRPAAQRSLELLGIGADDIITMPIRGAVRAGHLAMTDVMFAAGARKAPVQMQLLAEELRRGATATAATHDAIYVSRLDANRRRMENELQLIERLEALGVVHVTMSGLSLDEQIKIFANARVVVAPHGAALTNLLYLRPGCSVYEMFPSTYVQNCYEHLTGMSGSDYISNIFQTSAGPGHSTTWAVDIDLVAARTEDLLEKRARGPHSEALIA